MYTDDTKIKDLTVKELKEIIRVEVALLVAPNKNFYDYSKVYATTKTTPDSKPLYPDPHQTPYC